MKIPIQGFALVAIFAVCGLFLASCGGGSSATTINGISVPPEPDATQNNATIAGIDSNANGVRDDVERKVAEKSKDQDSYLKAINYAKIIQNNLTTNEATLDNSLICTSLSHPEDDEISERNITNLIANNEIRQSAYKDRLLSRNGVFIRTTTELRTIAEQCK